MDDMKSQMDIDRYTHGIEAATINLISALSEIDNAPTNTFGIRERVEAALDDLKKVTSGHYPRP
jgi:hypothetical protein